MVTETTFFNHSKNIIQEFLSTAIIFDDQASFGDFNTSQPKTVVSPNTRKKKLQKKVDEKSKDATGSEKEKALTLSHDLNAKKVINSFAEKGILCSVIKPEEDELETLHETATLLSEKADLIIFDWELSQTSGKTALQVIKRVITHFNNRSPQQLRLIAIYTGTTNINKVFSQIRDELSNDDFQIEDHGDNCCQIDACRLLVFAKKAAKTAEGVTKVSFEDLADFLVDEYTKMTKGILSNVVMQSFSVIKRNTHQILKKFSGMDSPFLTHRTCLPSPEDAEDHTATLISEEIQSLLEEFNVGKMSGLNALQCYYDDNPVNTDYSLKPIRNKDDCLSKDIKSFKEESHFYFQDISNNRFQFICELKPLYAQRLSNKFAANISRVATNNSEWLRRCEEKRL